MASKVLSVSKMPQKEEGYQLNSAWPDFPSADDCLGSCRCMCSHYFMVYLIVYLFILINDS